MCENEAVNLIRQEDQQEFAIEETQSLGYYLRFCILDEHLLQVSCPNSDRNCRAKRSQ